MFNIGTIGESVSVRPSIELIDSILGRECEYEVEIDVKVTLDFQSKTFDQSEPTHNCDEADWAILRDNCRLQALILSKVEEHAADAFED